MKYSKDLINKMISLYNSGKGIPELSKLYNIPVNLLRNRMYGKIIKRPGLERIHTNNHNTFLSNINYNINGCWEWAKGVNNKGYGQFSINGKVQLTHRYSYSYYIGECKGYFVCHKCDNPKCVNPDHLFLGNYKLNSLDRSIKMRTEVNKLTITQVKEIRDLLKIKLNFTEIGRKYNVTKTCIKSIHMGGTWKWLK